MQIQSFINIPKNYKADFIFGLVTINILGLASLFGYLNIGDIDTDGGIFAAVALKDLNGGILYQTAWENKPPGIIYLIEGLFMVIPNKVYAMYALPVLGILFLVSGMYSLAYIKTKSLFSSILFLALFLLFTINDRTIGYAMYTEIYGSIFLIWSLFLISKYNEEKKVGTLYIASFLLGFTIWFKEPFALIVLPTILYLLYLINDIKKGLLLIVYASLPSLFFLILLQINGALLGFFEMIQYNFSFTEPIEGSVTKKEQLEHIWFHIIEPLNFLFLAILFNMIRGLQFKENRGEVFLYILLMMSAVAFVIISPHSFNHYYIPFIILFFISFLLSFKLKKSSYNNTSFWLSIILFFTIYKLNSNTDLKLKWRIEEYKPDKVAKLLSENKGATLFIDLVDASGYYVKGNVLYPTYLPVPIAAHFSDSKSGIINRQRIYEELSKNKPDFLITEQSSSYMYWHIPDKDLYYGNYEKIDSVKAKYGKNVILWKLKQH